MQTLKNDRRSLIVGAIVGELPAILKGVSYALSSGYRGEARVEITEIH